MKYLEVEINAKITVSGSSYMGGSKTKLSIDILYSYEWLLKANTHHNMSHSSKNPWWQG